MIIFCDEYAMEYRTKYKMGLGFSPESCSESLAIYETSGRIRFAVPFIKC